MGGKKRGMSLAEKREVLLKVFSDSEDVFALKELEKIASKRGINSMVVKDLLQGMADDDLIHAEKVGISTYYWMFPSEAGLKISNLISSLESDLKALTSEKTKLDCELATRQALVYESEERPALLKKLKLVKEERGEVEKELGKFADCDHEVYLQMKGGLSASKDAANRWVDNIWSLEGWMKKKFEGRGKDIDAFFKSKGVTEDLDTIP
ncbi:meiotic nuclear division protein [Chloropicon primus]|uniref:Meiotic nuclear division protein 1 homolog n=1 Tax=Chloropicon primus TaxID=1764295 RepID=A0A5B8MX83_9CHLO|nr:meiotic nuclear division protein [Chloropicon primus]UPR03502.1 meiotic nuclear division protein [Chloropicon primus]|mmetsp:Transcript_7688/g.21941  ORF Transcript_7688/g.21941 Transcript_7688/m.21941 type:complete len:209 (-) Transcript_7688:119-745(-)|eukprot:QDZ24295.1 meiotic nuclear division protein [Chloropicon primus]